jgi:hypothetical protein
MGECGDVRLMFQPEFSRFGNADREALHQVNERERTAEKVKVKGGRGFYE